MNPISAVSICHKAFALISTSSAMMPKTANMATRRTRLTKMSLKFLPTTVCPSSGGFFFRCLAAIIFASLNDPATGPVYH